MFDTRARCPRAFIAAAPRAIEADDDAGLAALLQFEADPASHPAIESGGFKFQLPPPAPLEVSEHIEITSYHTNRVELSVKTTQRRMVVLNELYDKDWRARVNDATAAIFPVNYLFRSVVVPAGHSTIVFEYRPPSFMLGIAISGFALLMIMGYAGVRLARRRISR
jgi:hypothetical protein